MGFQCLETPLAQFANFPAAAAQEPEWSSSEHLSWSRDSSQQRLVNSLQYGVCVARIGGAGI
jgi:hypothetical protein